MPPLPEAGDAVSARRSPSGAALQVVRRAWDRHPLALVMAVAAVLRLAAALLSRGYAFHDDHFEVVEVAQHWVDGLRDWLGRSDSFRRPSTQCCATSTTSK